METIEVLTPEVGTKSSCEAFGVSRASVYRLRWLRNEPPAEPTQRPSPPRTLSAPERQGVLDLLNSERFADQAPQEVYAALWDEGQYLCSPRTMYRVLDEQKEVKERRNQTMPPKAPEAGIAGYRAE